MANDLGPLEFTCDAPPYGIVKACHMIGLVNPEDVAWFRYTFFVNGHYDRRELFNLQSWKALLGMSRPPRTSCPCGADIPRLEKYTFTFRKGSTVEYLLSQCRCCRTIFWEEP